jgi:linoleoyl-CoA desaturase
MARYDLPYVTGSLGKQVFSVYSKVVQLSLPNKVEGRRRRDVVKVAALRAIKGKKGRTAKRRS